MRHDPAGAAIVIMMRSLKMPGMAQAVQDLHEQGSPAFDAAIPILSQLLKAEMAEREVRSVAYHMKAARFPAYKDLSSIRLDQAVFFTQSRSALTSAFAVSISFLMTATIATFAGFPAARSAEYFALRSGLKRMATRAGM